MGLGETYEARYGKIDARLGPALFVLGDFSLSRIIKATRPPLELDPYVESSTYGKPKTSTNALGTPGK